MTQDNPSSDDSDSTAGKDSNIIVRLIDKPVVIDKNWSINAQLNGLVPEKNYGCYLQVDDFFGIHNSDTVLFTTKGTAGGAVLLTADSVRTDASNNLLFYGSMRSHYRAFDSEGLEMKVRYGYTLDLDSLPLLDQELVNYTIDTMLNRVNDTVTCVFHCTMDYVDSCWYALAVKDHWGNCFSTDTMKYSNAPAIAVWAKSPTVDGSTMVTLKGKCQYEGPQNMTIKERGFCYKEGIGVPTIADTVWKDNGALEWNVAFEHQLTGLKPNTTYSCRVYFKVGNIAVTYSEEVKTFTTENEVELTLEDPFDITATTVNLKATIGETQHGIAECKFLWREINNPNDTGVLTFENAGENVIETILNEEDHTFTAMIENLKPMQKYVFGAYIKLNNGEERFSNTQQVSTEEE